MKNLSWAVLPLAMGCLTFVTDAANAQSYRGYQAVVPAGRSHEPFVPNRGYAVPNCCSGNCRNLRSEPPAAYPASRFPASQFPASQFPEFEHSVPTGEDPSQSGSIPAYSQPRGPFYGPPAGPSNNAPGKGFFSVDDDYRPSAAGVPQNARQGLGSPFYERPRSIVPTGRYTPVINTLPRPFTPAPNSSRSFTPRPIQRDANPFYSR